MKPWEQSALTLEQGLLSAALQEPSKLAQLPLHGLTIEDFTDARDQLEFVLGYVEQYKCAPTHSILKQRYPNWAPPDGAFEYWVAQLRTHVQARRAQMAIRKALEHFDEPAIAIPALALELSSISTVGVRNIMATDGAAAEHYQRYLHRQQLFLDGGPDHVVGIRTAFDCINQSHVGWLPGEMVGIIARPTVGKSWLLINEVANAWLQGYRVLFVSPEMPASQIALRIYAVLAHKLGIPFSHRMAYEGNPSIQPAFERLVSLLTESERWWTVDSINGGEALGVSDIRALQRQYQADVVGIDGISLLRNEQRAKQVWEEMRYNAYSLRTFATSTETVLLVSHQAVNAQKGVKDVSGAAGIKATRGRGDDARMPTLNDAAHGEDFVRACSTIISLAPDQQRADIRWYSFRKTRERETPPVERMALHWDVDKGLIQDMGRFGENQGAILQAIKTAS